MGRATVSGGKVGMAAPVNGIALSSLAEGSIVKVNESGTPVEFYVIKHDYESALNGTGRTLLLRKNIHSLRVLDASGQIYAEDYTQTQLDTWLNATYLNLFGADEKALMSTTKFYRKETPGGSNRSVSRAIFILSLAEYGISSSSGENVGSSLSAASTIRVASYNGVATSHWTRQYYSAWEDVSDLQARIVSSSGARSLAYLGESHGVRPCFTFPSNTLFDKNTLVFQGVA